jgi:hypothetical protein
MNTIWLKIAGIAVVAVIAIVVIGRFRSGDSAQPPASTPQSQSEQEDRPKTFYDMAEQDKRFNEPPAPVEEPRAEPAQEPVLPPEPAEQPPAPVLAQADTRPPGVVYPSDLKEPRTLYFVPMSEEDEIQAQQLLPYATAGRSIGRLPVMQYGLMNKACLQIEERWPDSWYAFRAKQMLEEIIQYQDRYAEMYKITPQRLDISRFLKPRQGTQPLRVEPIRR